MTNSKQQSHATDRDLRTGATYDETPYESYTYPHTHPEQQAIVAKLFGFKPVDLEKARVLELGCAGGGNILPLAIDFPNAEFYGIDLSPVQIDEANRHKTALELSNITFEALDIMDIGPKHGKFDYIICHGVFSWVPDFVRDKILKICRDNLSPNGLACISYNVMPGWAAQKVLRDMMILHTQKIEDQAQKIAQAKLLVDFLARFMPQGTPMQQAVLNVHNKFQSPGTDSYVLHEYLEPNNNQFYFTAFAETLQAHDLKYVGDSELNFMFTGNLGPEADQALKKITDPIAREQYIDFITNRQFRLSIVTPQNAEQKAPTLDIVDELYFTTDLKCVSDQLDDKGFMTFEKDGRGMFAKIGDPVSQTLFKGIYSPSRKAYSYSEIVEIVTRALGEAQREQIAKLIKGNALIYSFKTYLQPRLHRSTHVDKVSNRPKAFALSRYQARFKNLKYVITANYTFSQLTPLELAVLRHLDGTCNMNELVDKVMEFIKSENLTIPDSNNFPIIDPAKQKATLKILLPDLLHKFVQHGLLIA